MGSLLCLGEPKLDGFARFALGRVGFGEGILGALCELEFLLVWSEAILFGEASKGHV